MVAANFSCKLLESVFTSTLGPLTRAKRENWFIIVMNDRRVPQHGLGMLKNCYTASSGGGSEIFDTIVRYSQYYHEGQQLTVCVKMFSCIVQSH